MKFKIKRNTLLDSLSKVSRAVSNKSALPILSGIKFELDNQGLTLTGSDSDIAIQTKITENIEIIEIGSVVLSSRYILDIIRKIDSDEVYLHIIDGSMTCIEAGKAKFTLNGSPIFDYPRIDFSSNGIHFPIQAPKFKEIVDKTAFATSESETRPVLTGVNFMLKNQTLTCNATDSYRLARIEMPIDTDITFNVIIPKKSLIDMSHIINDSKEILDLYVSDKKVLFKFGDYVILSRLIDGTFPDVSRLFNETYQYTLTVASDVLASAIDRCTLLADAEKNIITLKLNVDEVTLSSYRQELGSMNENLEKAFYKGEDFEISFSGKYLSDAIRSINTQTVKLSFAGVMKSFIVQDLELTDNTQMILPVRTL